MSEKSLADTAASVHQRLLNVARETHRPFSEVLQYFAMERFLYRLSQSKHVGSFVLKGALLFRVWETPDGRATRDIDLLAYTDNSTANITGIIGDVCALTSTNDRLTFDQDSTEAKIIKEGADYEGVRVRFRGLLGTARITMQVDIGFGDVVHPKAVTIEYPTILDLPSPMLRAYPPETVVAEKVEAMVHLGDLNSRTKDFYDIWRISQQFSFDFQVLREAIRSTFENRSTSTSEFSNVLTTLQASARLQTQWRAFLSKAKLGGPDDFSAVLQAIDIFLAPVFASINQGDGGTGEWLAPGPWSTQA